LLNPEGEGCLVSKEKKGSAIRQPINNERTEAQRKPAPKRGEDVTWLKKDSKAHGKKGKGNDAEVPSYGMEFFC